MGAPRSLNASRMLVQGGQELVLGVLKSWYWGVPKCLPRGAPKSKSQSASKVLVSRPLRVALMDPQVSGPQARGNPTSNSWSRVATSSPKTLTEMFHPVANTSPSIKYHGIFDYIGTFARYWVGTYLPRGPVRMCCQLPKKGGGPAFSDFPTKGRAIAFSDDF